MRNAWISLRAYAIRPYTLECIDYVAGVCNTPLHTGMHGSATFRHTGTHGSATFRPDTLECMDCVEGACNTPRHTVRISEIHRVEAYCIRPLCGSVKFIV